jgi:hypothetical protein
LAGVQRKVVKQGKRNSVVRFILAKGDKEKIAAWKQDLVRVLHIFNVCSIGFFGAFASSAVPIQTELAIDTNIVVTDTHVVVSDTRTVVADTHTMVADAHTTLADTRTMVADIHRNMLTEQEGTSGKTHLVGATCHPPTTECLPSLRFKPGQGY